MKLQTNLSFLAALCLPTCAQTTTHAVSGVGEMCGGPDVNAAVCALGLECMIKPNDFFDPPGTCQQPVVGASTSASASEPSTVPSGNPVSDQGGPCGGSDVNALKCADGLTCLQPPNDLFDAPGRCELLPTDVVTGAVSSAASVSSKTAANTEMHSASRSSAGASTRTVSTVTSNTASSFFASATSKITTSGALPYFTASFIAVIFASMLAVSIIACRRSPLVIAHDQSKWLLSRVNLASDGPEPNLGCLGIIPPMAAAPGSYSKAGILFHQTSHQL
ncbi:hypothetical protein BC830DRAFT_1137936 [Chytriomyces sp. MP71]|nr:hypothetical protein BC830DRAFT_1137936 [Chytriomyces sp. MP71]